MASGGPDRPDWQDGNKGFHCRLNIFKSCVTTDFISAFEIAANSDEQMIFSPRLPATLSSRAHRLTAGPITVKSRRSCAPTLPYIASPTCRAMLKFSGSFSLRQRRRLRICMLATASSAALSARSHISAISASPSIQKIPRTASPMNFRTSPPLA